MGVITDSLVNHVISADETGNSTKVLLGAAGEFTGAWEDVEAHATVAVALIGSLATDGTLFIESSQDGGTVVNSVPFSVPDTSFDLPHIWNVVEKYIRIRYVNGTTPMTGTFQLQTKYSNSQQLGLLQNAGDTIGPNTDVQIVKAVLTGEEVGDDLVPTGNYINVQALSDHGVIVGIPPKVLFQVKRPTDPVIPTGAGITIDPVLNTEPNVVDSGWLPSKAFGGGSLINIITDADLTAFVMNASDALGNNIQGDVAPTLQVTAGFPGTIGAAFFDDFFRIVVVNTSGGSATAYSIKAVGNQVPASPVFSSIDQPVAGFFPAPLTRSVGVGKKPDGSFANTLADGLAFSTTALLGNGVTYDSTVLSLIGFSQVQTAVLSDVDGTIVIDFSQDSAGSDILRTLTIPYVGGSGFKMFAAPAFTPYVRYRFTADSAGQTDFYFDTKFLTKSLSGQLLGMDDFISPAMVANLGRNVIVGQDEAGDFNNVTVTETSNDAGTYHNLNVVSGARPSQLPGRVEKKILLNSIVASALQYTVTANKTLFITDMLFTIVNTGAVTGLLGIHDALTAVNLLLPLGASDPGGGGVESLTMISRSFAEPLSFDTGVFFDIAASSLSIAGCLIGYEE